MKYTTLFIYIAVNVLLFVLNWSLFTTVLEFDLGFATFATLPFLVLQIFGGLLLGGYMIWDRMKDLKREVIITNLQKKIVELQKNSEIEVLKKEVQTKNVPTPIIEEPKELITTA